MNAIRQRCIDLASEFFVECNIEPTAATFKEGFTAWLKEKEEE